MPAGGEAEVDLNRPGRAVRETQLVTQPLAQLQQRVQQLLDEFPDNPLLTQLQQLARRIQGAQGCHQDLPAARTQHHFDQWWRWTRQPCMENLPRSASLWIIPHTLGGVHQVTPVHGVQACRHRAH